MGKTHITKADRELISELYLQDFPIKQIAGKTGRHFSTIHRELKRGYTGNLDKNGYPEYDPQLAEDNYRKMLVSRRAFKFKR